MMVQAGFVLSCRIKCFPALIWVRRLLVSLMVSVSWGRRFVVNNCRVMRLMARSLPAQQFSPHARGNGGLVTRLVSVFSMRITRCVHNCHRTIQCSRARWKRTHWWLMVGLSCGPLRTNWRRVRNSPSKLVLRTRQHRPWFNRSGKLWSSIRPALERFTVWRGRAVSIGRWLVERQLEATKA
ncbi:Hypothetical protein ROUS_24 [Brevibacterium phage Rousseau]|nr:Hypothetical protein ROUS_24 [Brevibacterium phage Rousseau]